MGILTTIGADIITSIAKNVSNKTIDKVFDTSQDELKKIKKNLPELFELHLIELIKWSSNIPFIGLNKPKDVGESTIELSISSNISKYGTSNEELIIEDDLLNTEENILLIGQPGAGKTTTMKRIVLKYFIDPEKFHYDFPILIRLRDLETSSTISTKILDVFGINYRVETMKYEDKKLLKNGDFETQIKERTITYVGDIKLDVFIAKFLNKTNSLLVLDGLDEVPVEIQKSILKEIESIGLRLSSSKIVLTVRKSKIRNKVSNFTKYEIKPLDNTKVLQISEKWLGKEAGILFNNELKNKPYNDLANRPIFLTLLMILWNKFKYLPLQPYEVYKEATFLIVTDWDEHRDIVRNSKYSDFNTRKKLKFLFELSYFMTYRVKQKVFASDILKKFYEETHLKYKLPIDEITDVVSEIESHNGIISEAHHNHYEFSHLSIQEYLCAEYIVTLPYSQKTVQYFYEYPEPLAIAICISGDASIWFSNLILNSNFNIQNVRKQRKGDRFKNSLFTLISRLLIESPSFNTSNELGLSILFLLFNHFNSDKEFDILIIKLVRYPNVIQSINLALTNFKIIPELGKSSISFRRYKATSGDYFIDPPHTGKFEPKLLNPENGLKFNKKNMELILLPLTD
jgi:predicted NACHT family NTPase